MDGNGSGRHFDQTRIVLRPVGSGLPLGFFSFGIGMLLLACSAIGWIPVSEQRDVAAKPFFTLLLLASVARMVLSGIYEAGGSHELYKISGGIALALAALAMYGGSALSLEDARQRDVLPLFRRGAAETAFQGYEAQLERLEAEPGVRQQL